MAAKQADPPAVPVPSPKGVWKTVKPFVNGGASGMLATCIIQPIDMVKVRLQLGATGSPVSASLPHRCATPSNMRCLLQGCCGLVMLTNLMRQLVLLLPVSWSFCDVQYLDCVGA
jgi:Mitochondrial carrier protein